MAIEEKRTAPLTDPAANLSKVQDLCQDLYAKGDAETAQRLAFEAGQLEAFFSSIRANAEQVVESAQALAGLRTMIPPQGPHVEEGLKAPLGEGPASEEVFSMGGMLRTRPAELEVKAGQPETNEFDLGEFFGNVSRSVVDAQRGLDRESLRYAREQADSPVPPAFYSIPTVHAEIKAGLSSTDGNGILVKLISDESQSSFSESTISFDIVSSAPPPGKLGNFTAGVPRFLAVEGPDFDRLMDALGNVQPALPDGWQQRTIIVRDLDPTLGKLKQTVLLAFVFGPVPPPKEGSATDYSQVPLTLYKSSNDGPPMQIQAAQFTPELVRALSTMAFWLGSITVR